MLLEQNRTRFLFHFGGYVGFFFIALWFPLEFVVVNQKTITKIIESESNLVFFSSDFWYDLQKD